MISSDKSRTLWIRQGKWEHYFVFTFIWYCMVHSVYTVSFVLVWSSFAWNVNNTAIARIPDWSVRFPFILLKKLNNNNLWHQLFYTMYWYPQIQKLYFRRKFIRSIIGLNFLFSRWIGICWCFTEESLWTFHHFPLARNVNHCRSEDYFQLLHSSQPNSRCSKFQKCQSSTCQINDICCHSVK